MIVNSVIIVTVLIFYVTINVLTVFTQKSHEIFKTAVFFFALSEIRLLWCSAIFRDFLYPAVDGARSWYDTGQIVLKYQLTHKRFISIYVYDNFFSFPKVTMNNWKATTNTGGPTVIIEYGGFCTGTLYNPRPVPMPMPNF